jgi:uncharacterized protein YbjT (DUF2867 family)
VTDQKTIVVIGATGAQGGGLVRALIQDPQREFAVRAVTRKTDSEKAAALRAMGAEVVAADLDDVASLTKAFQGAYGAFCVTNFWEHFSPAKELSQAKNLAEASRAAHLRHVVWSTLEDTRNWVPLTDDRMPTLMDHYKVPHFDAKGEANACFIRADVPTTFLYTSFYWDNLIHFGMGPKKGADGNLGFILPMADKKLPGIAAEDIGKCAFGIFQRGTDLVGTDIGIVGETLSGSEMAAKLSRALGQDVVYAYVPPEVYRTFGFPGADDLANMFQFKRDFSADFCSRRDQAQSQALNPALQDFDQWLAANKGLLTLA